MDADDFREVGRRADGSIMWRVRVLHWLAALAGVQFKVGGWPYGASHERAINAWRGSRGVSAANYPATEQAPGA